MFDLITALIILPIFVAFSDRFRSWLMFSEARNIYPDKKNKPNRKSGITSGNVEKQVRAKKNAFKFDYKTD